MSFLPAALRTVRAFLVKGKPVPLAVHLRAAATGEARGWGGELLELALAPYFAWLYLDAVARVFWRLAVRKRLLEWQTASHSERQARTSLPGVFLEMAAAPLLALAAAAPALAGRAPAASIS